ncbi:MAG TPA: ATP-binding protein [Alphaproteobacteria bacterium]|nr:ATP-binding protein [Alphaproteobacteria bacterium]
MHRCEGSSLGLPLGRQLMQRLGGTLEIVSSPGTGADMTIALPLRGYTLKYFAFGW